MEFTLGRIGLEVTLRWIILSIVTIVTVGFIIYLGIKKIIILELGEMRKKKEPLKNTKVTFLRMDKGE